MNPRLLDANEFKLIHNFRLAVRRPITGLSKGEERSPAKGGGIEFADWREYQPGDDVRQVDWAVFLRLEKLMVRLCAEERELSLVLIIDNSASMSVGSPSKFRLACKIAAILGGIAMSTGNRATVCTWGQNLIESIPGARGSMMISNFVDHIAHLSCVETVVPLTCMRQFSARYNKKCLAILLSDFLYPQWQQVINLLSASGNEAHAIQILAQEELDPLAAGEISLDDCESHHEVPLQLDGPTLDRYHQVLVAWKDQLLHYSHSKSIGFTSLASDQNIQNIFHKILRQEDIVC
jgi:uncharacterized protein (DUF58 family)